MSGKFFRRFNVLLVIFVAIAFTSGSSLVAWAALTDTSSFTQVISAGSLSTSIVDATYVDVGAPSVVMSSKVFSWTCLSGASASTGTFGTNTQRLYVSNPSAANAGWTLSVAGSATTALWTGTGPNYFDFNDSTGATPGCTDGADVDVKAGQMTIDASVGTITKGQCAVCTTANITKGASTGLSEGVTNSVTIMNAAALSDDIGDWYLTGATVSQTIPAEQPTVADYALTMVITVAAS